MENRQDYAGQRSGYAQCGVWKPKFSTLHKR